MKGAAAVLCALALLLCLPLRGAALEEDMAREFGVGAAEGALPEEASEVLGDMGVGDALDTDGVLARIWNYAAGKLGELFGRALKSVVLMVAVVLLCALAGALYQPGAVTDYVPLAGALAISAAAAGDVASFIGMGTQTLRTLSDFSKALLPCIASASAVSGAVGSAAAKYAATALFMDVLITVASWVVMPLVYAYIAAVVAAAALGNNALDGAVSLIRWLCRAAMTLMVLAFTTYLSITGVVTGAADAMAVRMTKTAVSAALPVVGGIVSEAASAVAAGAAMVRGAVGVFGLLAVLAVCLVPFLALGIRYLLYKAAAGFCEALSDKRLSGLISGLGSAFGMVLSLTGCGAFFLYFSIFSCIGTVVR